MNADEIRQKILTMNDFVLDAENTIRGGTMVELSGLDKDISVICNRAISLPAEQAREVQPYMGELIANLERLSVAIKDYREDLKKG